MNDAYKNTLVLFVLLLVVATGGGYLTYVHLPGRVDELEQREKVLRLKEAELSDLFSEQAESEQLAVRMKTRWESRYKTIPETLRTAQVVQYLNERTRTGYEDIGVTFQGAEHGANFDALKFRITGQGFFGHVYRLLWQIEQRRELFRVSDLDVEHRNLTRPAAESERERRFIMTEFSFTLRAFYGGMSGVSAPDELDRIPADVLPPQTASVNPFYPVVMQQLPPNHRNRVDVEKDDLVSIVGNEAMFDRGGEVRRLGSGDPVYLGEIVQIDPKRGRVVAELNKGGIYDRVVLDLNQDGLQEQARGETRLSAIDENTDQ